MKVIAVLALLVLGTILGHPIDDWMRDHEDVVAPAKANIWAVLIAGSSGYYNYRHQADISHIYHLLTKQHGIPQNHVITLMYNDIAYNRENPTPGKIINALHGKDVYEGVMIDYMDRDVTPETFLSILKGETMIVGSRKTLRSTAEDYVFVNFADHGGPGILGFPNGVLHVADLTETLQTMHEGRKYKQMLWYVEACFAGSMFSALPDNVNITAHTAANTKESSYACIFSKTYNTYLGDCWSLNWMNNTEQVYPNLVTETVEQQYEIVKKMTNQSHASIYGDLSVIYKEPISTFLGHPGAAVKREQVLPLSQADSIRSEDVLLESLRRKKETVTDNDAAAALEEEIQYHEQTEVKIQQVLREVGVETTGSEEMAAIFRTQPLLIRHPGCNKEVLKAFFSACYKTQPHPYLIKYLHWATNLCNAYSEDRIVQAIAYSCNIN